MSRPTDSLPTWAADATYDAPGDDWDGDPTKVEPALAKIEQGWEPTEAPSAEYLNWWMHRAATWAQYLEESSNFRLVVIPAIHFVPYMGTMAIQDGSGSGLNAGILRVLSGPGISRAHLDVRPYMPFPGQAIRGARVTGFVDKSEDYVALRRVVRGVGTGAVSRNLLTGWTGAFGPFDTGAITPDGSDIFALNDWEPHEPHILEIEFDPDGTSSGSIYDVSLLIGPAFTV